MKNVKNTKFYLTTLSKNGILFKVNFFEECEKVKMEVTKPERNSIAKAYGKVVSISVSFFIPSKKYILDLFNNLYIEKELINIY